MREGERWDEGGREIGSFAVLSCGIFHSLAARRISILRERGRERKKERVDAETTKSCRNLGRKARSVSILCEGG